MKRVRIFCSSLISAVLLSGLTGCSSMMSSELPNDNPGWTVTKAYQAALNGGNGQDMHHIRRKAINYTIPSHDDTRLPNPDINLYVYPHYIQEDQTQVKIPGYTTKFPLYETVQYE